MTATVEFNPLLPEVIEDPYPFYARLRAADPVHQSAVGMWLLSRYDDVALVLRDPRFGQPGFANSVILQDPPDHTRLRGLVSKATSRPPGRSAFRSHGRRAFS